MHKMSDEQQRVADYIKKGYNVTVDACAGSGKSTTILSVAKELPDWYHVPLLLVGMSNSIFSIFFWSPPLHSLLAIKTKTPPTAHPN